MVSLDPRKWFQPQPQMEAKALDGYGKKEDIGTVVTTYAFTPRLPHPPNMINYTKWANDAEANIAFNVLTDIIAGVGYYTEMSEGENPDHKNKQIIDEYGEKVNLDEDLQQIVKAMLEKGFCPVQVLGDYDLHILPPETFYIWRTVTGEIVRYTQERSYGDILRVWEKPNWQAKLEKYESFYDQKEFKTLMEAPKAEAGDIDEIKLFFHRQTTSHPYGKSLLEPIGPLLDGRQQLNKDMLAGIHRWANPIPIMETSRDKTNLEKALTDRDVDQWVLIGNVQKEEVRFNVLAVEPAARFVPYIDMIYYQICEGLHAPLLLYLKNATEASATVMMESVDRLVNGIQRYVKRRVERYLFEPQVGNPVPRLVWGQPKTGLEEITLTDIASIYNAKAVTFTQVQHILKNFISDMPEPTPEEIARIEHPMPLQPFQKQQPFQKPQPEIGAEQVIEKLNDLNLALNIVESNFKAGKLRLTQTVQMGAKAIEVNLRRIYRSEDEFEAKRQEEFDKWIKRLMNLPAKEKQTYSVTVGASD